jgi:hypothetical protein
LSGALFELANIIAGALVFGQLVSSNEVSLRVLIFGIIATFIFYVRAYTLSNMTHND